MKPNIECFRCILSIRLREIENSSLSNGLKLELMKRLTSILINEFSFESELTDLASRLYMFNVQEAPSIVDYYKLIKQEANRNALFNINIHEKHVSRYTGYDKFKYLVYLSALANLLDHGVAEHKIMEISELTPSFIEKHEVYIDESYKLYHYLKNGGLRILWLFDNAGEAVYDTLLIREIINMGNTVEGLVKNEPGFQNDISINDALYIGLDKLLSDINTYGCYCSTIHLDKISPGVFSKIKNSDLIIAKGMSHFEYLHEVNLGKPICFIFIPKCNPVAERVGKGSRGKIVILFKELG